MAEEKAAKKDVLKEGSMTPIYPGDLKRGDRILANTPTWVKNIVKEMVVCNVKDCLVELKDDGSSGWYQYKSITVYEVLNRKVTRRSKRKEFKSQLIDITLVKAGDIVLYGLPWTECIYQATAIEIKDTVIMFNERQWGWNDWKEKHNILVYEIIGKTVVKEKEKEICPFMSTPEKEVKCKVLCGLYSTHGCVFCETVHLLKSIRSNTEEDDE